MKQLVALFLAAGALSAPAVAHDFWLSPSKSNLAAGELLSVTAVLGHADDPEPYPRNPAHVRRFVALGPAVNGVATETALVGLEGRLPTGRAALQTPGLHALVYHSNPSGLTMLPDSFEDYLREEGLEHVVAERARRGESSADGVEAYVRCAKALVHVGEAGGQPLDRVVGLPLEFVAEFDVTAPGEEPVGLRLLFRGQPIAGVQVEANGIGGDAPTAVARTDAEGRVRFDLPRGGVWCFAAVHMERAAPEAEFDWQSWWASLRVELPQQVTEPIPPAR